MKSALKTSTGDLLTVVDGIERILNRQYEAYTHQLAQDKIKVAFKLPRDLMRDLIGRVSPYALSKIYDQYQLMKAAEKDPIESALKACDKSFANTMGLSCSHMIVDALNTPEKKLLLDDVHPHWRFKKPKSSLISTRDFVSDPPPNSLPNEENYQTASEGHGSSESFSESFDDDEFPKTSGSIRLRNHRIESSSSSSDEDEFPEVSGLVHNRNNRIESPSTSSISKDAELQDLLNIAEPKIAKAKGRPKGSKNKKGAMTQAEKKAARSTKRDLSGFEHVEREFEVRIKRAKKNTKKKTTDQATKDDIKKTTDQATKDAKKTTDQAARGRESRGRGGASTVASQATSMITRSGASASKSMELSSNTESSSNIESDDEDFNNLPGGSDDEDFDASRQGDEEAKDEWMD